MYQLVNGHSCGVRMHQQYCVASHDVRFNHSLVALLGRVCGPQRYRKLGKAASQ